MANPIYSMVSSALAQVVSERAADTMLRASLRDARVSPDTVSPQEMQRVLAGPLEERLATIMPPRRARLELSALAGRLAELYPKAPTLFPEMPQGDLLGLDEPPSPGLPGSGVGAEAAGVQWNMEALTSGGAGNWNGPPGLGGGGATPIVAEMDFDGLDAFGGELVTIEADDLNFELDDFEFDDPEEAARVTVTVRYYDLGSVAGQDTLLTDLARFDGVQGVVLCDFAGNVVRSRVPRGAGELARVMASTAVLLRARPWRILSADLGAQTVCMRPIGTHLVALLASSNTNLGRLMGELAALKETA